jgi:hypothetical protein
MERQTVAHVYYTGRHMWCHGHSVDMMQTLSITAISIMGVLLYVADRDHINQW